MTTGWRKGARPPGTQKALGHPRKESTSKTKHVRLTLPVSHPPGTQSDSPDEDPLHGRRVTEDGNDDGVVHHDAKADGSAMQIMGKRVQDDVDIVFMVPKHGGKDQKRVVISSATPWEDIYQRLATIMGNALSGLATDLVKQRELPEDNQTVTYNSPPNNHMFDVPPAAHHGKTTAATPSSATPPIIINMPEGLVPSQPHRRSPPPSSDPFDYLNEPWPTLQELLTHAQKADRHHRDFTIYEHRLVEQELYGPDDIEKCSAEELFRLCDIPAGAAKHLISEAKRISRAVRSDVKERKRCRED
ncbi:hypothetical protein BJV74DRAFT_953891 [Russula compacta]|nr:hypothetical protein BJV74DRAFT_953891 [Russula compacta]